MTEPSIATQTTCGQCGSVLPVEHGSQFVTCEFCGTTSYVDKARAVFHYALRVTVREDDALAALRRWMAGNETVRTWTKRRASSGRPLSIFPCGWSRRSRARVSGCS
jgi:hypothetical protein